MQERGILVGCDSHQEWLLPWWWKHYSATNSYPVAFADFGMSEKAQKWCSERGMLISITIDCYSVAPKEKIAPSIIFEWEKSFSPFWESRNAWFKKPFAMLKSPFCRTIWTDLDCEIKSSLDPLFSYVHPKSKMGLTRIREPLEMAEWAIYNSGVIVFEQSSLLESWAHRSFHQNDRYLGDQDILSHLIFEMGLEVGELPPCYNWQMCRGYPLHAVICHWSSQWGKEILRVSCKRMRFFLS